MSSVKFRKILKKDLHDVFLLLNQLKKIDLSSIDKKTAWDNFSSNSSSNAIVGIYNSKVVAYGSVVVENKIRGEVAGHIEDIVVDSSVRGNMVGSSLINELIKICIRKNCYRVTLFCKESLVNFYSANGFNADSVNMKKYLESEK